MDSAVRKRLERQLDRMTEDELRLVLAYIEAMLSYKPVGTPGRELLRFAGTIAPEDVAAMEAAIEEENRRFFARER